MVRFSVYWESFVLKAKLNSYTYAFDLVNYLADVTCAFLFQEIHDLFKDYEIKYCYVDRNKRTGKNLKSSSIMHWRVHSIPLSVSPTETLNGTSPSVDPWGTPIVTSLNLDIELLTTTLKVWQSSLSHELSLHPIRLSLVWRQRFCVGQCQMPCASPCRWYQLLFPYPPTL